MYSQKFFMQVYVSVDVLLDAYDYHNIFNWFVHRFKMQLVERNLGLITRPTVQLVKPDLLDVDTLVERRLLRAYVVARVVKIQSLEKLT